MNFNLKLKYTRTLISLIFLFIFIKLDAQNSSIIKYADILSFSFPADYKTIQNTDSLKVYQGKIDRTNYVCMILVINKIYPTTQSLEEYYEYIFNGMARNKDFKDTKSKFTTFHKLHAYQSSSNTQLKGENVEADFFIVSIKTTMFVFQIIRPKDSPSELNKFLNEVMLKKEFSINDQIN